MFRTELPLTPHAQQLPLSARVLTVGSCFSDSIGQRLATSKVQTLVNPFGTVFNPLAACKLLRAAAGEDHDWQQHVVEARGRWQSYDLHATVGADSPVELLQHIQQLLRQTGVFLMTADVVVLTLGTAWAYRLKETGELVSNCHKVPAERFDKELLTPDEIINAVAETHAYLRQRNPKLRFVLTVSPVRHLKDTLPLNAVSKSVLRVACHYLSELLPDVAYFPAYELLLDDLRDYRFYAADMLHPSDVAEDYIWERFARTYFDVEFGRFRKEWDTLRQALHHRPLYPAAPEHRQFLEHTLERLERLAPQADLRMEILDLRRQLENLPQPKPRPALAPIPEDDEERIDIGEGAEPYVPTETAWRRSAEVSVETTPEEVGLDELDDFVEDTTEVFSEQDQTATTAEEGTPRKKRRSRGGAKRNKKKHAARLAAEAAAAEAANSPGIDVVEPDVAEITPPVVGTPVSALPPAPKVVILASEAPLQTNMARRKRGSRRARGKKPAEATGAEVPEPTSATEAPTSLAPPAAPETTETLAAPPPPDVPSADGAPAPTADPTRPGRSGRTASEKRAAAVRKPRRPAARGFKPLYAEPAATPNVPAAAPTPEQGPVAPPAEAAAPPAAVASGRLTAAGKASRSRAPRPDVEAPTALPPAAVPLANEPAETPAVPSPKRAPARRKSAPAATEDQPAPPVPNRRRNSKAAPADNTPATEAAAPPPTARRSRKSATAAETPPETTPPAAPARARRAPRPKPAAPADDAPAA